MKSSSALTAALLAASATGLLLAQDTPKPKSKPAAATTAPTAPPAPSALPPTVSAEDVKGVRVAIDGFTKAFNEGDLKALSALFTQNAEVVDEEGAMAVGLPAITAQFEETFQQHPGQKLAVTTDSIKFFADDVAQEEGRAVLTHPDGSEDHSRLYAWSMSRRMAAGSMRASATNMTTPSALTNI